MKIKLNTTTQKRLKKAGWSPTRVYKNIKLISQLESIGYVYFKSAEQIISSFGGLFLEAYGKSFDIDFEIEAEMFDLDIENLKKSIGCNLFPLGIYHQFQVFIGEDYRIYIMLQDIKLLANTFEDFINHNY